MFNLALAFLVGILADELARFGMRALNRKRELKLNIRLKSLPTEPELAERRKEHAAMLVYTRRKT